MPKDISQREKLIHSTAIEPLIRAPCLGCGRMMTTTKSVRRCCDCHYREKIRSYVIEQPAKIYTFGTLFGRRK